MKQIPVKFAFAAALAAFSLSSAAYAQDTATVSGRVTDASGALVPNAAVTVVNGETNFTSESRTNGAGLYRIPSLRPGPY